MDDLERVARGGDADDQRARAFWARMGEGALTSTTVSPGTRFDHWEHAQRWLVQGWGLRQVRRFAPGPRLRRAVDLGCGYGDFTARLGALADEIEATDYSPGLARAAAARLAGHPAARVTCGDARDFDAYDSPDLVSIGGVLMYMTDGDAERVLERLAPGGLLLHREYVAFHDGNEARRAGEWASFRRPASRYRLWAQSAGLELLSQRHSPGIFAAQAIYATLGLRLEWWSRALELVPTALLSLIMASQRACSWTAVYRAPR